LVLSLFLIVRSLRAYSGPHLSSMPSERSYYDVLGVEPGADRQTIRKAYLRLSLQHHPDKNVDNVEEAKAKFIEIGHAYEVLSDPEARSAYDRERRGNRNNTTNFPFGTQNGADSDTSQAAYDSYRDAFDATVAGMSEADLAAAVGTASVVGSAVGSLIGSRLLSTQSGARGAGNGVLASVGSLVGSAVASEMATRAVRTLHQQSVERIEYAHAKKRAVERGDPLPDPPAHMVRPQNGMPWKEKLKSAAKAVQMTAAAASSAAKFKEDKSSSSSERGNGNPTSF
jgi:curved DNA-binding protein CbpA